HDGDDALAYHSFEAGAWEPARRYALRAAARALSLGAPREALQHFDRAVTATENAGQRLDPALLTGRGRAHETLGSFSHANDDFASALIAARECKDRRAEWVALHALGMLWAARDYERAGGYRLDALFVARTIDDSALMARSLNRIGNWFVNREDPHSGIPHHDEALAIFDAAGDQRGVAETVDLLAMTHHVAGAQDTAVALYERSIDLFSALDDRRALATALAVLPACGPSHHASAGAVRTSVHTAELLESERAVRLASEIGWRAGEAFARYLLADCLAWRGQYARALRHARESLVIAREIEHLEWQCGARRVLGVIALELFDLPTALAQLTAAHDIARRLGSATWIRWTGAPLAIAFARASRSAKAADVLADVDKRVPIPDGGGAAHVQSRTLGERFLEIARAEMLMSMGAPADVLETITDADEPGVPRVALLRGQALTMLGRWDDAMASLKTARRDAREQDARPLVWRIDAAEAVVHLGRRRRLEARRSLDAARATAREIEAELDDATLAAAFRTGVDRLAPAPPERTPALAAKAAHGGLTRRERDTAALVAQGKPNRAIARQLGIGERTVEGYVASALAKLSFGSRTQLAVWAAEHGLARTDAETEPPRS
ncbi:MAG TPA: LuxR C-terminal-related transcriptional regulator, partial [Gemmatimonadaceae bacterium]|nr:LuxR C-terminal-related transcriptional regulator [Gemmatimonadaceae bacterium]